MAAQVGAGCAHAKLFLGARVGPQVVAAACDAEGLLGVSQRSSAFLFMFSVTCAPCSLLCASMPPMRQDNWGSDSLMMAAAQGHTDAVQLLLRHGADPNARDSQV